MLYNRCTANVFFTWKHLCPLERGERFRNEERRTGRDLTFSIALFFRNFIISSGNLFCQMGNGFHVFFCFCRSPSIKYSFTLFQPPSKACPAPSKIISSVSPLLITSRSLWEPASGAKVRLLFFDILYFTHNIQRERVNSERRKGNIDSLSFKFIDQEGDELF